jgi:hypothetical protein
MYDYLKNEIKGVSQEIFAGQIKKWNAKTIWPKESGIQSIYTDNW